MILTDAHRLPVGINPAQQRVLVRLGAAAAAGDVLAFDVSRSSALTTSSEVSSRSGSLSVVVPPSSPSLGYVMLQAGGSLGDRVRGILTGIGTARVFGAVTAGQGLVVAENAGVGFLRAPTTGDNGKTVRAVALETGGAGGSYSWLPVLFDGADPLGQVFEVSASFVTSVILEQDHPYHRADYRFFVDRAGFRPFNRTLPGPDGGTRSEATDYAPDGGGVVIVPY